MIVNSLNSKLDYFDFYSVEVVDRGSETQLQVGENYLNIVEY